MTNKGYSFELKAIAYLERKNVSILKHRYKTPYGEIDILAMDDKCLVAIEVKVRKTKRDSYDAIQEKQKKRIADALMHYANQNNLSDATFRFDAILFYPNNIVHIQDAWQVDSF